MKVSLFPSVAFSWGDLIAERLELTDLRQVAIPKVYHDDYFVKQPS